MSCESLDVYHNFKSWKSWILPFCLLDRQRDDRLQHHNVLWNVYQKWTLGDGKEIQLEASCLRNR